MDVRNWSIDQVLSLPGDCFGQRWPIVFAGTVAGSATVFYIHDLGLPERTVLWQLSWCAAVPSSEVRPSLRVALYLADQIPTAAADLVAAEPVFKQQGQAAAGVRYLQLGDYYRVTMKLPIQSSGRRFALVITNTAAQLTVFTLSLVVSSFPTEIPDCLLSA